jgi:hypothetical protein
LRDELTAERSRERTGPRTHGMTESPEYLAWDNMRARCTRPSYIGWENYGGRGITVCGEWLDSFEAFYDHIGPRPGPGYSVDRIDNDGNYEPGNVRWATHSQQRINSRRKERTA